jgi:NTP pyrophosphatase (non-canonical NTP hydrolase)
MKSLQNKVKELDSFISSKTGKTQNAYAISTNIAAEVGELCDEVIGLEGDRIEDTNYKDSNGAAKEIVDVIYNLLRLANHYDIDVEEHLSKRLNKIKKKFE